MHSMKNIVRSWGLMGAAVFWLLVLSANLFHLLPSKAPRFLRFSGVDFEQYYAGGVVVQEKLWADMYADMSGLRPGQGPEMGVYSPKMREAVTRRGARGFIKNVNPPFSAPLFWPLSFFEFRSALHAYMAFSGACLLVFLVLFLRECRDYGLSDATSNLLVLLVGTGIPLAESVLMANSTLFVGFSALLVLRGLRKSRSAQTILGFAGAGLLKGFSVAWTPALFIWHRWKVLLVGLLLGVVVVALPFVLGATWQTYQTYIEDVYPASRQLYFIGDGNLCIPSFLCWAFGWETMPSVVGQVLAGVQLVLFVTVYGLAFRRRFDVHVPQGISLLAATLVFQVFSPVCWSHYAFNVMPFLPCALAVSRRSRYSLLAVLGGFSLCWIPIGNAAKYVLGMPVLGFGRLFGYLILLVWCVDELFRLKHHSVLKGDSVK